jgi:spore maturation protein CgeB
MNARPTLAFFGSSLVSSYWNGAATYYRGIVRALHDSGWNVTFYEPDALDRQAHRDIPDPPWARVIVYQPDEDGLAMALAHASKKDVLVKASGIGCYDETLEMAVPALRRGRQVSIFWDVDAPATLERMQRNPDDPFRPLVSAYDLVLTYGGGEPVIKAYEAVGARQVVPIYNAVDPDVHHPVPPVLEYRADLTFLGNRLPDREARVHEFFVGPARTVPDATFLLGGSGWTAGDLPRNVHVVGHVPTGRHNALNCSARAVLNINRASMARFGHSPATRVFEAAGAGACLITDSFEGLERFLEPDAEVLVAASGRAVADHLARLTPERARAIGEAARRRVIAEHTYAHRVQTLESVLGFARYGSFPWRTTHSSGSSSSDSPSRHPGGMATRRHIAGS